MLNIAGKMAVREVLGLQMHRIHKQPEPAADTVTCIRTPEVAGAERYVLNVFVKPTSKRSSGAKE